MLPVSFRVFALAVPLLAPLACGDAEPTEPAADGPRSSEQAVRVTVTFNPPEILPGEASRVWITLANPGSDTLAYKSPCTALAFLYAYRDGEPVSLQPGNGCFTAIRWFRIPPGDSLLYGSEIRARYHEGDLAPPGRYDILIDFLPESLPDLTRELVILDDG